MQWTIFIDYGGIVEKIYTHILWICALQYAVRITHTVRGIMLSVYRHSQKDRFHCMLPIPHASIPAFVSLVPLSWDLAPCAIKPRTSAELHHQYHDDADDADNEDHEDCLPHEVLTSKMMDEFVPWNLGSSLRLSRCVCRLRPRNWFARICVSDFLRLVCARVCAGLVCACVSMESRMKGIVPISFPPIVSLQGSRHPRCVIVPANFGMSHAPQFRTLCFRNQGRLSLVSLQMILQQSWPCRRCWHGTRSRCDSAQEARWIPKKIHGTTYGRSHLKTLPLTFRIRSLPHCLF